MSALNQFLLPNSITRPNHMTLSGPHHGFHSLVHMLQDPYYAKNPSTLFHNSSNGNDNVQSPAFDVRETRTAFFLDGEFPGVVSKEDVTIEKQGPRTLLVRAYVRRFDLRREWGPLLTVRDHGLSQGQGQSGYVDGGIGGPQEQQLQQQQQGGRPVQIYQGQDSYVDNRPVGQEQQQQLQQQQQPGGPSEKMTRLTDMDDRNGQNGYTNGQAEVRDDRDGVRGLEQGQLQQQQQQQEQQQQHHEGEGLHHTLLERHAGYLQRSFTFPCGVDIDALKARLRFGLLVIMVPKLGDGRSDGKRIDIED